MKKQTAETHASFLDRPGWPEITIGLVTYLVLILAIGLSMMTFPDDQAGLRGIFGMAANGVAGCVALWAANRLRIRDWCTFGFQYAALKWVLIGAVLGVVAFGLSFLIEGLYFSFITEVNTQADFQAAAKGGILSLSILALTGALFTPFGEEVLFRGVIANALNRYGAWAGIFGSAVIFAAVHGPSVIFWNAFMVGIMTGFLFRRTNSLWPVLATHAIYNGLHLLYYATL